MAENESQDQIRNESEIIAHERAQILGHWKAVMSINIVDQSDVEESMRGRGTVYRAQITGPDSRLTSARAFNVDDAIDKAIVDYAKAINFNLFTPSKEQLLQQRLADMEAKLAAITTAAAPAQTAAAPTSSEPPIAPAAAKPKKGKRGRAPIAPAEATEPAAS